MRIFIWLLLLLPLSFLLYGLFLVGVEDPIKYIYTVTGGTALTLLFITTSVSILQRRVNLVRYRRLVGLFGFFYALLHLSNFVVLDMELDPVSALKETVDKPFIYLGMLSFAVLLFMAVTSVPSLFPKYYKYHKLLYAALVMASIHFVMAQKVLSPMQWWLLAVMIFIGVLKFLQRTKFVKF
jgi:sulfoxide reductase heme-binding subunit YedZ